MMAMPWAARGPLSKMRSPSSMRSVRMSAAGWTVPMPVVLMNILSPLPRSTTLVSPVTTCTPAAAQACLMLTSTSQNSCIDSPSSKMKLRERYWGMAPHIARSFTVPLTASSPMDPPGKKMGETTKLSVVKAVRPLSSRMAPSWRRSSSSLLSRSKTPLSSSWFVSLPPLPWARVMVSKSSWGSGHWRVIFIHPPLAAVR